MASRVTDAELAIVSPDHDPLTAAARFDGPGVTAGPAAEFDIEPCAIPFRGIVIGVLIALPLWALVGWVVYRLL